MTGDLATMSLIAAYSAAVVYLFAFIAYALDLAARSQQSGESKDSAAQAAGAVSGSSARVGQLTRSAASGSSGPSSSVPSSSVLEKTRTAGSDEPPARSRRSSRFERIGFSLTIVAWLVHVTAVVMRGIAAGHVPWSNMFEFSLTGTAIIVAVFLGVQFWRDLRFLGIFITGLAVVFLVVASINFYVDVTPLPPPLQSAWLVIHVFMAILGTGFYAVGAGLSVLQLLQARREAGRLAGLKFLQTLPGSVALEALAYRVIVVGFAFWTVTVILGAVWAERAWGRYWGWDTKEVWSFVIWVIFAGYIHARATRGWRGSRAATLAIIGFSAVIFNFTIVNLFFKGLHSYSGL